MLKKLVLICALASSPAFAQEAKPADGAGTMTVAKEYIEAYSALDIDRLAELADEDIHFTDPTNVNNPDAADQRGRDAVIANFRRMPEQFGATSLNFEIENAFESGGVAVFQGVMTMTVPIENERTYNWRARVVSVLTVEDGKVIRHIDYADYGGAEETVIASNSGSE